MLYNNKKKFQNLMLKENDYDIIKNLDVGFFRVSIDGTILAHNRKYNEIFGIDPLISLKGQKTFNYWENQQDRENFLKELKKNGKVKNYIVSARKINGETVVLQGNSHLIYDDDNIPIATEGTIIDITDKYNLQKELEESEKRYRDIAELLPDIIFETDLELNLTYVNSIAFDKFGYSKEDMTSGLNINQFIDKNYQGEALKNIKLLLEGKELAPKRYLLVKKDGTKFHGLIHSKPIYKNKVIIGIRGTITDISNFILIEQKLKESEKKYRALFENMNEGFAYHEVITDSNNNPIDYKYIEVNPAFENLTGIKKEDLIGKNVTEAIPGTEDDPADWIGRFGNVGLSGTPLTVEEYSKALDRWYKVSGYSPKKGFFAVTFSDITERKKTELKIKESETKFRTIAEQSLMGICILQDFEVKYINQQMADIYGYPISEINQWKANEFAKVIHPEYRDMVIDQVTRKQQGSLNIMTHYIAKIITKNGKIKWVENYSKPIKYQGRHADLLTQIDITPKMIAEQKVRESETKYRHLYESSPYAILLVNMEGKVIDCNVATEELSGFNRNELLGMNFAHSSFIPKEHIYTVIEDFKILINNKVPPPREIQLYTNEKKPVWVLYQASFCTIENEKVIQVIIEDISERKKAEDKLKESEAKYHDLFEASPDGVILTDLQGKIIECNTAIETLSGYSSSYFIGKNFLDLELLYIEDAVEQLKKGYSDLFGDNLLDAIEFPIKTKDNKIKWISISSDLLNMKRKRYILSIIHDITSLKEAEKALKDSEKKFRDILETSSVGVMEFDVINQKLLYINPKLLDIVGFYKEEINEEIFRHNIIHQSDLTKLLKTNEESELEFRITDKQGRLKWLAGKRIPHYNENGKIDSIRVWLDDITEKKMYENLIYELNINFLNFTTDIRKNIDLLLTTCLKLLEGNLILYVHKSISDDDGDDDDEKYQIITSGNKVYNYNSEEFDKLFISVLFKEEHDFPQTFLDIDKLIYGESDQFIKNHQFKGSFGKVIKSHEGLNSAVCIFYRNNPVVSGQDKLVLFLICDALEIEQRRWQVQKDLEEQNITLNKINKLKSELFSRTSHELKTPLISIKGFTELLLTLYKNKLDSDVISILKEISDGSKRLEEIINLLLDSTKLEAGQLSLNLQDEDLTFLINFTVKELQGLAKLRDQTISISLHDKLETKFDKERIYEVISNLLVNAIKYTPPRGKITIESKINNNSYEISIKDDGIGFTKEEKSQVFRQFGKIERYGKGWDIAADGTGLGLYISKKLIELHKGKIWFESEGRNKGTTFYFSIPILK